MPWELFLEKTRMFKYPCNFVLGVVKPGSFAFLQTQRAIYAWKRGNDKYPSVLK